MTKHPRTAKPPRAGNTRQRRQKLVEKVAAAGQAPPAAAPRECLQRPLNQLPKDWEDQ